MIALEFKRLQKLDCKPTNQTKTDTLKVIVPDKLIQVDAEKFEWDDKMSSENFKIVHSHNVVLVTWVIVVQMFEYS